MTDENKILTQDRIGQLIREAREARGWSVYKLAAKSGVHGALIWRIENGFNSMRVDTLQKLCTALNLAITFPLPF